MKSNETPPTGTPENTPFSGYIPLAGTIFQENSGETGEFSKRRMATSIWKMTKGVNKFSFSFPRNLIAFKAV
jgi:hypothetical protein